jgi:hypothetical protein
MNLKNVAWQSGFAVEAAFLVFLVVSCSQQPTSTAPPSPTSTEVAVPTSTAAPQDDSGFNSPDPSSLPEVVAPLGLGKIDLPDDAESIGALFNNLPPKLMGGPRTIQSQINTTGEIWASYGKTQPVGCGMVGLQAMDVSTGDFYPPGWTAERVVAVFTTGADWTAEDFGRDGDLFWVRWNNTCGIDGTPGMDAIYTASWGKAGSPWFFSVSASDPEGRDELTAALVGAVTASQ